MRTIVLLPLAFVCSLSLTVMADHPVEAKDIASGPEDILSGRVRLPEPGTVGATSCTALLRCDEVSPSLLEFTTGPGKSMAALLAADVEAWSLDARVEGVDKPLEGALHGADALVPGALARVVTFPSDAGEVRVSFDRPKTGGAGWLLLADGEEELRLFSHFGGHGAIVGRQVSLHTSLEGGTLIEGRVDLTAPDGVIHQRVLGVEGASSVATFTPGLVGDWTVRTIVHARDHQGVERVRTNQQIMRVVRPELTFVGDVRIMQEADGRIGLTIPVTLLPQGELGGPRRVAVGCEVWGRDGSGELVPVCWVARMHQLPAAGGPASCGLRFDPRWIALAGIDPMSIELRELRAHGAEGFVLLDHDLEPRVLVPEVITASETVPEGIEPGMQAGHSGEVVSGGAPPVDSLVSAAGHVLLISHGYCTDIFPWQTSDFSGDFELFEDYEQNLSHDTFALRFEAYGRNFKSMGIAGHSQGGNAAAHLFTFYWSALDWPTGDRRIQGVGVPWQGTALAGNAAVLGEVFGVGCGTNYDMTYEGSAAWLSFIPGWVREDVWFWTTSFTDGWFYDYCQIVTDILLSDPDDGTVERYAGQLDGGNNGGHKTGWCHTRLMRDPPQCKDPDRNVELSAEAAR